MNTSTTDFSAINTSTAKTPASTLASSTSTAQASSDRFLKLLVAQLQNQDPLNPTDNAQVTSQIAQINTVSGIEKLNSTVTSLSGQFVQMQALQGAALVGHEVTLPGNKLDIADGKGEGGFDLAGKASAVKVEVLNGAGRVIDTLNLGAQDAGTGSFSWNSGSYDNTSGLTFRVTATSGTASVGATALMQDKVTAVSTKDNALMLELSRSGTVAYSTVKELN